MKLSPFFHLAATRFLNSNRSLVNSPSANSVDVEVQTSFLMYPLVSDKVFVTLEQGGVSKMQLLTPTTCPTQAYTHRHTCKHTPSLAYIKLPKDVTNFI